MIGAHRKVWAQRVLFAVCVLGPGVVMFFLPLLFYRIPLLVHLSGRTAMVNGRYVLQAVGVALVWFGLAGGIVLWPSKAAFPPPREWGLRTAWQIFVAMSTVGCVISVLHAFYRAPLGLEEIVHQIAFAPVLAMVLGVWLLREIRRGAAPALRAIFVQTMLLADAGVALVLPVVLARAAPSAVAVVAVLYGSAASGVLHRRVRWFMLVALLAVLIAIPLREFLREAVYGFHVYDRPALVKQESPGRGGAPQAPPPAHGSVAGLFERIVRVTGGELRRASEFDPAAAGLRLPRAGGPLGVFEYETARVLDRVSRLTDLAYVVEMTPRHIPYAGGETYYPLAGVLVPRVVWRDKPTDISGTFYARRYGLLPPDALIHQTYNLPIPTEGWLNAGWWGVIAAAVFFGLALRFIWQRWIGSTGVYEAGLGNITIGMAVVAAALDVESSLTLTLGGVVHALVVYWTLDIAIRAWDRRGHRLHLLLRVREPAAN